MPPSEEQQMYRTPHPYTRQSNSKSSWRITFKGNESQVACIWENTSHEFEYDWAGSRGLNLAS